MKYVIAILALLTCGLAEAQANPAGRARLGRVAKVRAVRRVAVQPLLVRRVVQPVFVQQPVLVQQAAFADAGVGSCGVGFGGLGAGYGAGFGGFGSPFGFFGRDRFVGGRLVSPFFSPFGFGGFGGFRGRGVNIAFGF